MHCRQSLTRDHESEYLLNKHLCIEICHFNRHVEPIPNSKPMIQWIPFFSLLVLLELICWYKCLHTNISARHASFRFCNDCSNATSWLLQYFRDCYICVQCAWLFHSSRKKDTGDILLVYSHWYLQRSFCVLYVIVALLRFIRKQNRQPSKLVLTLRSNEPDWDCGIPCHTAHPKYINSFYFIYFTISNGIRSRAHLTVNRSKNYRITEY